MLLETAAVSVIGLSAYSFFVEPRWHRIMHRTVLLKGASLPPLRILHLSDFHFYPGKTERVKLVHRLAQEAVDLIFITGDLIDTNDGIPISIEALRPLRAKYGVYCTFGNHDYVHVKFHNIFHVKRRKFDCSKYEKNDIERLAGELAGIGIQVLRNQRVTIEVDGAPVIIAGIDDPYTEHDDIASTFAGYRKEGPCFVLIHTPDRYQELAEYNVDMVFSGHTHGGQICLPFYGPIITRTEAPREFAYGLNRLNGTVYFTTRGIGSSKRTYPRFNCRPEVNFFTVEFDQCSQKFSSIS